MTTDIAYYNKLADDQILDCFHDPNLAEMVKSGVSAKRIWSAIETEQDIIDIKYLNMARRTQYNGCIGGAIAQDWLDYIHLNENKKVHEIGSCYKKISH